MEGRKRAAAQSVTKHERIGEEIGDDRLQKKKGCQSRDASGSGRGSSKNRRGKSCTAPPATLTMALRFGIQGFINHFASQFAK